MVGHLSLEPQRGFGRIVAMPPIRRVLVLAANGAQSLDVLGPVEVFFYAEYHAPGAYAGEVVAPTAEGQVTLSNGRRLGARPLPDPLPAHDTLLVAGGEGARRATGDPDVVDWVARAAGKARRTT